MLRRSSRLGAAALRRLTAANTTRVHGVFEPSMRSGVRVQTRAMGFFSDLKNQLKAEMDKNEELKKSFEEIEKTKEQLKNVEKAAKEKMQEVSSMTEEAAKNISEQASAASQKLKDSYTATRGAEASAADADEKKSKEKAEDAKSDEEKNDSDSDSDDEKDEKKPEADGGAAASVKNFFSKMNAQRQTLIKPKWKEEWRSAAKELFGGSDVGSVDEALASVRTPSKQKPQTSEDGEPVEYTGPSALVAVKEEETAWQKVSARFREAPIIQGILDAAKQAARTEAGKKAAETAKKAKNKISDATEDVREIWETSQNPYVYCRAVAERSDC
jgi:hypothetical protein